MSKSEDSERSHGQRTGAVIAVVCVFLGGCLSTGSAALTMRMQDEQAARVRQEERRVNAYSDAISEIDALQLDLIFYLNLQHRDEEPFADRDRWILRWSQINSTLGKAQLLGSEKMSRRLKACRAEMIRAAGSIPSDPSTRTFDERMAALDKVAKCRDGIDDLAREELASG